MLAPSGPSLVHLVRPRFGRSRPARASDPPGFRRDARTSGSYRCDVGTPSETVIDNRRQQQTPPEAAMSTAHVSRGMEGGDAQGGTIPHVVVVGAGFAGYEAARRLARTARGRARITIINPTDYFLYVPLLPEVATGTLEPRRVTVSLSGTLPGVRLVLGQVDGVDLARRVVSYSTPEGLGGVPP